MRMVSSSGCGVAAHTACDAKLDSIQIMLADRCANDSSERVLYGISIADARLTECEHDAAMRF